jgi:hypothetical protein
VRWVIIIIVLVFDPLAVILVLAGLSILHREPVDIKPEILHNGNMPTIGTPEIEPTETTPPAPTETTAIAPTGPTALPEVSAVVKPVHNPTTPSRLASHVPQGDVIINGRNISNRNPNEK